MGVGKSKRREQPSPNGESMKFTIGSDFTESRDVQSRILEDVRNCGYDEQSIFAIKLAMEEAFINAIRHGNKLDPNKKVHIEAKISPVRAEIIVEDEGPGFKREKVPDPTTDDNLCKCSGRGILLMESYMNSIKYTKNGRRVRMVRINQRHLS
ncbi:MAG TPA: ATP-binding protein [Tepidisphaeraceae bacterium]|nr:ATP-binding protein [Tepidisphaeraceae bacterium]